MPQGKHRRNTVTGRKVARVALTGAVVAAPFVVAAPANAASPSTWDKVAECESSGNWNTSTGNGFSGGLQFTPSTWKSYGGTQYASQAKDASREQQIAVAERILQGQGPNAWPNCGKKAGLTKGSGLENQNVSKGSKGSESSQSSKSQSSKSQSSKQDSGKSKKSGSNSARPAKDMYTVSEGDTLGKIGSKLGVDWKDLFSKNKGDLQDPNTIKPGQQLRV